MLKKSKSHAHMPPPEKPLKTRREVLKIGAATAAALAAPVGCTRYLPQPGPELAPRQVRTAVVLWYSQTDNTRRMGRLMAAVWRSQGIRVHAADIREFSPDQVTRFDMMAMGCPVNHYEAPAFARNWLARLPALSGMPVAAFVTHGIPASNQHNTACTLLDLMGKKSGIPVGLATFGNLGTYPPYWAFYPEKAISAKAYPNQETFVRAREYARTVIQRAQNGLPIEYRHQFGMGDIKKSLAPIWFSKLITDEHGIDPQRCTHCGTCREKCPVNAIDPDRGTVDKSACVDCMGCINNCPAGAVNIVYWGKKLTGYRAYLEQQGIRILEPRELRT